jgi:hypothetical protein
VQATISMQKLVLLVLLVIKVATSTLFFGSKMTGAASSHTGTSVASAGDFNNDGFLDLIVGSHGANNAFIVYGNAVTNLDLTTITSTSGVKIFSSTATSSNKLGIVVGPAGDVNNDGFADVLAVDYTFNTTFGAVYLIFGGSSLSTIDVATMSATRGIVIYGTPSSLGTCVGNAGDVNKDGKNDFFVGDPLDAKGNLYIFYGKTSWASTNGMTVSSFTSSNGLTFSGPCRGRQDQHAQLSHRAAFAHYKHGSQAFAALFGNPAVFPLGLKLANKAGGAVCL